MSIFIKRSDLKVKNPTTGTYQGQSLFTENDTQTQINRINSAGTTQVNAVNVKGQETLASIPDDYTDLSNNVDDLKSALAAPKSSRNNKLTLSIHWQQGAYNTATGAGTSSQTRIRSIYFVPFNGVIRFAIPNGFKLYWYKYAYWNYQSFIGHSGSWLNGTIQIDDDGCLYKFALAKEDDSVFTPSSAPEIIIEIQDEANVLTPTNTEYLNTQILSILSCYGTLKVPIGRFNITAPITLSDNQAIIGDGFGSILVLDDGVADSAIKMASGNIIRDLQIVGRDEDYTVDNAPSTATERHGLLFTGSSLKRGIVENCIIRGFTGFAIFCYYTSTSSNQGLSIKDCYLIGNHGGIFCKRSEFHRISGVDCNNNYIGAEIDGGNITVYGCNFSSNQYGMMFDNEDGTSNNNTHGEVVGCIMQHSRISAVKINNMASGEIFTGCNIDNGGVNLINAHRIIFNACNFMYTFSIDIDGGGLVMFSSCNMRDYTTTHTTIVNNNAVKFVNCFNQDGDLIDPV